MLTLILHSLYAIIAGVPFFWQLAAGTAERVMIGKIAVGEFAIVVAMVVYAAIVLRCANSMYGKQK